MNKQDFIKANEPLSQHEINELIQLVLTRKSVDYEKMIEDIDYCNNIDWYDYIERKLRILYTKVLRL